MPSKHSKSLSSASPLDRRSFLRYLGAGASTAAWVAAPIGAAATSSKSGPAAAASTEPEAHSADWSLTDGMPAWKPVASPVPSPGSFADPSLDKTRLHRFEVVDDMLLPEGFAYRVLAGWGDRFGPDAHRVQFGYNNDYTGLVPIEGTSDDFYLFVNHEELSSRPWLQGFTQYHGGRAPRVAIRPDAENPKKPRLEIAGTLMPTHACDLSDFGALSKELQAEIRYLCEQGLGDLGISVLRIRRSAQGHYSVVRDATDHRRISTFSTQNIDPAVVAKFAMDGPAASVAKAGPGTFGNCSGGTTPWGTFLTCEENIQNHVNPLIKADGSLFPRKEKLGASPSFNQAGEVDARTPEPTFIAGMGAGLKQPLDGRGYGWVCQIDPKTGLMAKHSMLGRFRHENVALRCQAGKKLAAYMGDDRRGGHVWKFVSRRTVANPKDPANWNLFGEGTLYAAKFDAGYGGRWIPLQLDTPLAEPQPQHTASQHLFLPRRPDGGHVAVGVAGAKRTEQTPADWMAAVSAFAGKPFDQCTLGDLVSAPEGMTGAVRDRYRMGVLLMDAYAMAGAAGATPASRPEDLEVHPTDNSVYIAFTDHTGGGDGSPDLRVFPDGKGDSSRMYGGIFRIVEEGDRPDATKFGWGRFVPSGEVSDEGGGFACADNLVFDPKGHLWMVTDISTSVLNQPVDRRKGKTKPGGSKFPGVFGNNSLFFVPTHGPGAGTPFCFGIGPVECELTGPTFCDGGRGLILSVQHPGEVNGTRRAARPEEERNYALTDRRGEPFQQTRKVPLGSNWPSGTLDQTPRPCVVVIAREAPQRG